MTPTTLYLSQLMGPAFLLLGLSLGMNQGFYKSLLVKMEKDEAFLFLASIIELVTGMAVVLSHSLWTTPAEVIVTLIGWAMIVEGAAVLLLTKKYPHGIMAHFSRNIPALFNLGTVLLIVLGGYLSYLGYMM
jgi:hypothetical protein